MVRLRSVVLTANRSARLVPFLRPRLPEVVAAMFVPHLHCARILPRPRLPVGAGALPLVPVPLSVIWLEAALVPMSRLRAVLPTLLLPLMTQLRFVAEFGMRLLA